MSCCSSGTLSVRTRPFGATADHALTQGRDPVCRLVQRLPDEPTDRVEKRGRRERCPGGDRPCPRATGTSPASSRTWRTRRRFPDARGPCDEHDLARPVVARSMLRWSSASAFSRPYRLPAIRSHAGRRGGRARSSRSCPSSASACAPLRGPPRARRRSGNATRASSRRSLTTMLDRTVGTLAFTTAGVCGRRATCACRSSSGSRAENEGARSASRRRWPRARRGPRGDRRRGSCSRSAPARCRWASFNSPGGPGAWVKARWR